jgi:hypothetical protein
MTASVLYQKISAIGGFTALTNASADWLALDPARCSGLGDAPLRTTVYDAPGLDGELIFPPKDGQHIITLAGDLVVTSTEDLDAYFTAVDTLYGSLKTALDAMKTAPGDLVTPGGTLKVWKQSEIDDEWQNYWVLSVTFSLIVDVFA